MGSLQNSILQVVKHRCEQELQNKLGASTRVITGDDEHAVIQLPRSREGSSGERRRTRRSMA